MASIFENFSEDPKNAKIMLYPKKYDEHTYHFTPEVPPSPPPPRRLRTLGMVRVLLSTTREYLLMSTLLFILF